MRLRAQITPTFKHHATTHPMGKRQAQKSHRIGWLIGFPESFTYLSFFLYIGEFQKPVFLVNSLTYAFCRVENFVKKNPPEKRQNVHPYSFTSFNFAASSNH
jgi:hypothetical protein